MIVVLSHFWAHCYKSVLLSGITLHPLLENRYGETGTIGSVKGKGLPLLFLLKGRSILSPGI
jgi:hypothetical protein